MKKKIFGGMVLMLTFLMACATPPQDYDTGVRVGEVSEKNEIYLEVSDEITVDATVSMPERTEYEILKVKTEHDGLLDKVIENLVRDQDPILIQNDSYADIWDGFGGGTEVSPDYENFRVAEKEGYVSYDSEWRELKIFEEGDWMSKGSICALPELENTLLSFREKFPDSEKETENVKESLKRSIAIKECKEILEALEISVAEEPYVCAWVTGNDMNQMLREMFSDYVIEDIFNDNDSCYYMLWDQTINDTLIERGNWRFGYGIGTVKCRSGYGYAPGSLVCAVYGKNGIDMLDMTSAQYVITEKEPAKKILSLEEALNYALDFYENVLIEEHRTIRNIEFRYVPEMLEAITEREFTYKMIPCWIFEVNYINNSTFPADISE